MSTAFSPAQLRASLWARQGSRVHAVIDGLVVPGIEAKLKNAKLAGWDCLQRGAMSAEEAERLGIVNAVFPPVDFEREVMERARRLAQGPSIAYRYMKENLNRAVAGELGECMDLEVTHHAHTGLTEDHREAAQAFVDKREPRFRGR